MKTSAFAIAVFLLIGLGISEPVSAQKNKSKDRYFMDVHKLEPGSVGYGDVAGAHELDLATQDKHDVQFITYWLDEKEGLVYCLSKADDPSHVHATHEEAHGLVPHEIYEVISGKQESYTGNGSLYLDIHDLGPGNVTAAAVEEAHQKDLAEQGKYKVNFINYWVDEKNGKVFCLSEAPSKDAVIQTHQHAHGLVPATVLTVKQGQ
jgi:hypothetical protein